VSPASHRLNRATVPNLAARRRAGLDLRRGKGKMNDEREAMHYGAFETVRDTRTGKLVALLPIAHAYDVPPEPKPRPRLGWWLMILLSWDAL
jgi:hypothetical protein